MRAGEPIQAGQVVYIQSNGKVGVWKPYNRWERLTRWAGRLLHVYALKRYHDRAVSGIALQSAQQDEILAVRIRGMVSYPARQQTDGNGAPFGGR